MLLLALLPFLVACTPSGTAVFDDDGKRVGRVSIRNEERATVIDRAGETVGTVREDRVFDSAGNRVGRVTEDDRILDSAGTRIGRIGGGTRCINRAGVRAGVIGSDIDDEAAGGACLLLLLLP